MTLAERRDGVILGGPADLHKTWQVLAGGARSCAEVLIDIAQNERAPSASRVSAAKTVLEMVGFKTPDVIPVLPPEIDPASSPTAVGESPSARIRNRLASLASASRAEEEDEIADAEIVVVDDEGHEVIDAVIADDDD